MFEKTRMPLKRFMLMVAFFVAMISIAIVVPLTRTIAADDVAAVELGEMTPTYDLSRKIPEEWLKFEKREENGEKIATFKGFYYDVKDSNNLSIRDWGTVSGENYQYCIALSSASGIEVSSIANISGYPTLDIPAYTKDGYKVTKIDKLEMDKGTATGEINVHNYTRFITAVIIPSTVTYVAEQTFSNFHSIEYFKAPFLGTDLKHPKSLAEMLSTDATDNYVLRMSDILEQYNLVPKKEDGSFDGGITLAELNNGRKAPAIELLSYTWYTGPNYSTSPNKKTFFVPPRIHKVEIEAEGVSEDYYNDYNFIDRAFFNLPYLKTVNIDNNIKSLNSYHLFCQSGIASVTLPDEISAIGIGCFIDCKNLTSITLPNNLQEISKEAFAGCENLTSINIPATVHTFGDSCFEDCVNLKDMNIYTGKNSEGELNFVPTKTGGFNIPTATKKIGSLAFAKCDEFEIINLSSGYDAVSPTRPAQSNLTSVGEGAFSGCIGIKTLIIPFIGSKQGNSNSKEAVLGYLFGSTTIDGTIAAHQQFGSSATSNVLTAAIPSNLSTIVVTGETHINRGAFQGIESLKSLTISSSATSMDRSFLAECPNLETLILPFVGLNRDNQFNPANLFENSELDLPQNSPYYKVGNYNVPKTFISLEITNCPIIKSGLLHNLTYIQEVIIGKSTTEIESSVFYNNGSLKRLVVPFAGQYNRLFVRGNWPHYTYYWWQIDIEARNGLAWMFSNTRSTSAEYVNNVFVGGYSDYDQNIRRKYIPQSLIEVEITNASVVSSYALRGFSSLKKIDISNSPSYIGKEAFKGCTSVTELDLPYLGYDRNDYGYNDSKYTLGWYFGDTGASYVAMHGFRIPYTLTTVRVRNDLRKVSDYAFYNCTSLSSIELTGNISELGYAAFQGCVNLGHLTTPNAFYTKVPDYAFYNCQTLDVLYKDRVNYFIPNTVKIIGNYAFTGTSVYEIDFTQFEKIGSYAFARCLQLTEVNVTPNVKSIGDNMFDGCSNLERATLSSGLVSNYLFKNCTKLNEINLEGVTNDIPDGFFYNCQSLTTEGLTMPIGNRTIGQYAFFNCRNLTSFVLGPSTTSIGKAAFQNCKGLSMMRIPNSVAEIQDSGWYGCDDSFYFTVLQHEEDWPEGWVDGWPCDFPVIIEGDVDDSVFEYVYDSRSKGYLITGVTAGERSLAGAIQLPTNHNGISVKGVIGPAFVNQQDVISFIVPSSYEVISSDYTIPSEPEPFKGQPFTVGKYVVIYMMDTLETAIAKGWHNAYDTEIVLSDEDLNGGIRKESQFSDNAVIYYRDYWEPVKGEKSKSIVPTLLTSQLIFDTDYDNFVYDGVTNYERVILSITTAGLPVGQAEQVVLYSKTATSASDYKDELYSNSNNIFEKNSVLTIFDSKYSNNLLASDNDAELELTPNDSKIKKYNTAYTYSSSRKESYAPIYLKGNKKIKYGIAKKLVEVFWTGSTTEKYSLQNHSYDGKPYSISFTRDNTLNDTTYVYGLGNRFYLNGVLETESPNVKYEKQVSPTGEIINVVAPYLAFGDGLSGEVRWRNDWNIYDINGRNVTQNFDIIINYCEFTIVPRKVKIVWEENNTTEEIAGKTYPLYQYTGSIIYPFAKAVEIDDETKVWGNSTNLLDVTYFIDDVDQIWIKPTYDKDTGTVLPLAKPNRVYAILRGDNAINYEIVDLDNFGRYVKTMLPEDEIGQESINGVMHDFHICKASVSVELTNNNYVMGANETYWYINDFTKNNKANVKIVGLGNGSIIEGEFRTIAEGNDYVENIYTTAALMFKWADLNGNGIEDDLHIYRIRNNERVNEDDCYDLPISVTASISVYYNEFDIKFYIDYDENGTNTALDMKPKVVGGINALTYTYITVGGDHTLTGLAVNSNLAEEGIYKATLKRSYGYNVDDVMVADLSDPMHFDEALAGEGKVYEMHITYSRKNYETKTIVVYFYNKKSTVQLSNFDKEYDAIEIDPKAHVTKSAYDYDYEKNADGTGKAYDQWNNLTFDFYYKQGFDANNIAALAKMDHLPVEVNEKATTGGYVVVVNCPETDYFEGLNNKIIYFEISRRVIRINLAEQGASKNWDGDIYSFTPNSTYYEQNRGLNSAGNPVGDLLPGHTLTGTLNTVSSEPKVYSEANDWRWSPQWGVHNTSFEDVSSCYKIMFINNYTIVARTIKVTVHNIDTPYGRVLENGTLWENFTFRVTAVDSLTGEPIPGCVIYYSDDSISYTEYYNTWRTTPYSFHTPDYNVVNYKVVAPHYQTVIGSGHVNVWLGSITYDMSVYDNRTDWKIVKESYVAALNESNVNVIYIDYDGLNHQVGVNSKTPWYAYARYKYRKITDQNYRYSNTAPIFSSQGYYELLVTVRAKSESYYHWNHEDEKYYVFVRIPGYGDGGDKGPIVITPEYESSVIAANNPNMANNYVHQTPYNVHEALDQGTYYAVRLRVTPRYTNYLRDNGCFETINGNVVPNVRYEYSTTGFEDDWTTNYISYNTEGTYKIYYRVLSYRNDKTTLFQSFGLADYDESGNPIDSNKLRYVTLIIKKPISPYTPTSDPNGCYDLDIIRNDSSVVLLQDLDNIRYDGVTSYALRAQIKEGEEYDVARASSTIQYKENIEDEWQDSLIWKTDPGVYTIYYKVIAGGYEPVGIDNDAFVIFEIKKKAFPDGPEPSGPEEEDGNDYPIDANSYTGIYDGLEHSVEVIVDEEILRTSLNISDDEDLTTIVYYSIDPLSKTTGSGWEETPITRKNVGTTNVYLKIEVGQYEPVYYMRSITITQAEVEISLPDDLEVEYSGKKTVRIENSAINVVESPVLFNTGTKYIVVNRDNFNTLKDENDNLYIKDSNGNAYDSYESFYLDSIAHDKIISKIAIDDRDVDEYILISKIYDGEPEFKFYSTKIINGNPEKNKLVSPIMPGLYFVEITYPTTNNVIGDSVSGFLTIVPKTLHIDWSSKVPYDGLAHRPVLEENEGEVNPIVRISKNDLDSIDDDIHILVYNMVDGEKVIAAEHTEIGDYTYSIAIFEDGMDPYYRLEFDEITMSIIKRDIAVIVDIRVPYIYNHAWSSTDEEEGIDLNNYIHANPSLDLVGLLQGHTFVGNIKTDSYTRGTYLLYYGIDPITLENVPWGDENSSEHANLDNRFIRWIKLDNGKNFDIIDSNGVSVLEYYRTKFDFRVRIVYPEMNISIEPKTIVYDGLPHSLDLDLNNLPLAVSTNEETTTDKYKDSYVEYSKDGEDWYGAESFEGYIDACLDPLDPYDIYVRISHPSYEEYYLKTSLTILRRNLDVEIESLEVEYDAQVHNVEYTVDATINEGPTAILYYLKSDYRGDRVFADIMLNGENSQYYSLGIQNPTEAGEYYAIVYFEASRNWNRSGEIGSLTILKRKVNITVQTEFYAVKDYDGEKFGVSLVGATIDQSMLVDHGGLAYDHHVYNNSTNYLTIRTNSANVKYSYDDNGNRLNIIEYKGSKGDFEFDPDASWILDKDGNNVSANYQPMVVGGSDITVLIRKIALTFEVRNLEREYDSYYDEGLKRYMPLPAIPEIITPDKVDPKFYVDNEPVYMFYEASRDEDGNFYPTTQVLNGAYPSNAGIYYVIVGFKDGTNYSGVELSPNNSAFVVVNPKVVTINWEDLNVQFDATYQAPQATYQTALNETKNALVYFYEDGAQTDGVINAGEYLAYAMATTDNNHVIDETSSTAIFKIEAITYNYKFSDSTISLEGYNRYFDEKDIPDLISGLEIRGIGGATGTDGQIHQLPNANGEYVVGTYYSGDFEANYTVYKDDINVTKSIIIKLDCVVIVETREIQFIAEDVVIPYNEQGYDVFDAGALAITYPNKSKITAIFKKGKDGEAYGGTKPFKECGTYEVYFILSGAGYSTKTGSLVITIVPANPSFEFLNNLSKPYDGTQIDDTLIQTKGNFNKTPNASETSDLIYTYYNADENGVIIDETPICVKTYNEVAGTLPIDAGYYVLVVTSAADSITSIVHNYTTLNATMAFRIKPKTLKVKFDFDKEVKDPTELNAVWMESLDDVRADGTTGGLTLKGLGVSQDIFHFTLSMDGERMYRGKYEFNQIFEFGNGTDGDDVVLSSDIQYLFGYDTELGNSSQAKKQTFILKYYLTNESRVKNTTIDTTANYVIDMSFKLNIHYPEIQYDLRIDDTAYTGDAHYAYIDIISQKNGKPIPVNIIYAASEHDLLVGSPSYGANNEVYLDSTIKLTELYQVNPGIKPVYLHISVSDTYGVYYEEAYDSIFIKVDPVSRNVTNNISTSTRFNKEYDLEQVGAYDPDTGLYLPVLGEDYIINYSTGQSQEDDYDRSKVYIEYIDSNTNITLDKVIDAGVYTYRFVIPESESGFFARTILTGSFTITKQRLYIINKDTDGFVTKDYTGSSAKYSVTTEGNHKIVNALGEEVPFNVSGVLITRDRQVGLYNGSTQGSIDWVTNYTIMANTQEGYSNVTKNYNLSIAGMPNSEEINPFKIKIIPGKMRINLPQNARVDFVYDGTNHLVPYRTYVELPTSGLTASYSLQDVVNKDDLDLSRFTSTQPNISDVKIEYTNQEHTTYEVKPYSLWIKLEAKENTFETEFIHLNVYVNQATPTLTINRPSEYEYSGLSVTEFNSANDITNTADFHNSTEYTWQWYKLADEEAGEDGPWLNMSGQIPKEVGTYKIVVWWTPTQSTRYTGAEVSHKFTIGAKHITYSWNRTSFVYTGKELHPVLDLTKTGLPQTEIEQLNVRYDYSPIGDTGDINSIRVGRYEISAVLEPINTNSSFKSSNYVIDGDQSITYNIVKRRIEIYAKEEIVYTGEQIALAYDPSAPESYKLDIMATGFGFADGHYTDAILMTKSAEPKENLYPYKAVGDELSDEFMWQNNSFDIYDANGTPVTSNYSVSYNVKVTIVLSDIACNYIYDDDPNNSETFEYDGKEHYLTVTPKNQGIYNVYYICGDETSLANEPLKFVDADQYEIYYKIYRVDENNAEVLVKEGSQPLNIRPKVTQIILKNEGALSKVYDGKDVVNPDVSLVGLDNVPIDLKWHYININNNKDTDKVRAVGNYRLVVEKNDENENYSVEPLEVEFEISEREIIISYPETSKTYDGTWWKVDINTKTDHDKKYTIKMSNNRTKDGLSEGHMLTATLRTAYTSARDLPYRSIDEFVIVNNRIYDEEDVDVTQNYSISYDLGVKISKAEIELATTDLDIEVDYDGLPHSIDIEVLKPANGYTITYSTYDEEFTTSNPTFTTRCVVTVNYRIEADNYEPCEGSATIRINGVKNPAPSDGGSIPGGGEGGEETIDDSPIDSHIQFDNPYTYDGNPYPTPIYIVDADNGAGYDASEQVVYYFPINYEFTRDENGYVVLQESELNNENYKIAPTEVGRYKFVIYIPANGNYEAFNTNAQTFRIERRKIEVTWHDLELEFNYEEQAPYATYTNVQGQEITLEVIDSGMRAVGEYNVSLGTTYEGSDSYEITNLSELFTISKRVIEDFVIMSGMEFEYSPEGKEIVKIRDVNGTLVTIDEDGFVKNVGQDEWTNEEYIIIVSKDRNADRVGSGEHTITVRLLDPENTKWASKGNADDASDDLVTEFSITPYTFYGIQHSTDTKLWYDWDKYLVIDTKPNNQAEFSLEIRTNGDNEFYSFIRPAAPDSSLSATGGLADYIYIYGKNNKLSSELGENAYIMITGINNFDFKLKLEYEITAAKPTMFELVSGSTVKFMYIEYLDGPFNYYKNDSDDDDPNSEIIYVKEIKDEDGNVIGTEEIKRENNAQENIYLGHIYQNTSIFEVLRQFKNDMSCMRVFSYKLEETTDELGNVVYKDVYELINPNSIDDDNDPYDNYKTTFFGTGMRIVLYEDATCTKEADHIDGIVMGDLNGDGKVNNMDGNLLLSFLRNEITNLSLGKMFYAGLVSDREGENISINNMDGNVLLSFLRNESNSDFNLKYFVETGE